MKKRSEKIILEKKKLKRIAGTFLILFILVGFLQFGIYLEHRTQIDSLKEPFNTCDEQCGNECNSLRIVEQNYEYVFKCKTGPKIIYSFASGR